MHHFKKLFLAYRTGRLIVHHTIKFNIQESTREYQTITSAFMFPIKGIAKIKVDDMEFQSQPGKLIYIPYGSQLQITVLSNEAYEYINIFHQYLDRFTFEMNISKDYYEIYNVLTKLIRNHQSPQSQHTLDQLFDLLQNRSNDDKDICENKIVNSLITYLKDNYHQDITLKSLAKLVGKKETQVSYLFKKYTNKSPIEYLIHYRLEKAIDLIKTTDLLIGDIGTIVGYQDPFYFSRLFKKHIGVTPTSLRKTN